MCGGLEYGPRKGDSDQMRISHVLHHFRGSLRMDLRHLGTRGTMMLIPEDPRELPFETRVKGVRRGVDLSK